MVIESKDSQFCYLFAQSVKGADVAALENVAHESEKKQYSCDFKDLKDSKYSKEEIDTKEIKQLVKTFRNE